MFAVRSFLRSRKQLSNYICTSSVVNSERKKGMKFSERKSRTKKNKEEDFPVSDNPIRVEESKSFFRRFVKPTVNEVAAHVGGDIKEIKKELIERLRSLEVTKEPQRISTRKMIIGAPGQRLQETPWPSFEGEGRLNIFNEPGKAENPVRLQLWEALEAEHLNYVAKIPPRNYFEELIQWTEEGKLWFFPIDNDQGCEEEAEVSFVEHIFLDKYLEPWCPSRGPLRKFMELVMVGLAKNPYLTVKDKIEHIKWYEDYFARKKKLLEELGAAGSASKGLEQKS